MKNFVKWFGIVFLIGCFINTGRGFSRNLSVNKAHILDQEMVRLESDNCQNNRQSWNGEMGDTYSYPLNVQMKTEEDTDYHIMVQNVPAGITVKLQNAPADVRTIRIPVFAKGYDLNSSIEEIRDGDPLEWKYIFESTKPLAAGTENLFAVLEFTNETERPLENSEIRIDVNFISWNEMKSADAFQKGVCWLDIDA